MGTQNHGRLATLTLYDRAGKANRCRQRSMFTRSMLNGRPRDAETFPTFFRCLLRQNWYVTALAKWRALRGMRGRSGRGFRGWFCRVRHRWLLEISALL